MKKIGVLISGSGTNLQALIDQQEKLNGEIVCVISNVPGAYALTRAEKAGIPVFTADHEHFSSRELLEKELLRILGNHEVELVVLAGFMRILTPLFLSVFPNRVINIHPALLPAFPGINAQQQAWDYGARITGATVHFVDAGVDTGPIILQAAVEFDPVKEDVKTLQQRILEQEHRILTDAVRLFCEDRLKVDGRKVEIIEK